MKQPSLFDAPAPKRETQYSPAEVERRADAVRRITFTLAYMDCPNWVCACRSTNFGRNKRCANPRCHRPRPESYVEPALPE